MDAFRPTTKGAMVDGKTTMSLSGTSGRRAVSFFDSGIWFPDEKWFA
jgi:hypothetical protein